MSVPQHDRWYRRSSSGYQTLIQLDPAPLSAALAGAEFALNRAISIAPASKNKLARLGDTVLGFEFTNLDLTLFMVIVSGSKILLKQHHEESSATWVRGTLQDFAALAVSDDPAATLINSGIEITGDSATLIALQEVIVNMDIDWEAPLVETIGDVAGHQATETLRGFFRWGKASAESMRRQTSEYLLEEGRLTPPKAELEFFFESVQSLSLKVDRLEAKVAKLIERAANGRSNIG